MEDFIKITDENYAEIIEQGIENCLDNKVDLFLNGNSCDCYTRLCEALKDCESPIEQLFSLSLEYKKIYDINLFNPYIDLTYSNNQEIKCTNGKKYRLDFYFVVAYYNSKGKIIDTKYYDVECDGYDYHSSKEQIKYDNERTRALQKDGFEIIRFSGSEIYINSDKCVDDLIKILISKCNYKEK